MAEKVTEKTVQILSELEQMTKGELEHYVYLQQFINQMMNKHICVDTIVLIMNAIWDDALIKPITPYYVLCRCSIFNTFCTSYIEDKIPIHKTIKYLAKGPTILYCFLIDKSLYGRRDEFFPQNWLQKELMRSIYKLIKHKRISPDTLKKYYTKEELNSFTHKFYYFYAKLAYSKCELNAKWEMIKEALFCFDQIQDPAQTRDEAKKIFHQEEETKESPFAFEQFVLAKIMKRFEISGKFKMQWKLGVSMETRMLGGDGYEKLVQDLFEDWQKEREITETDKRLLNAIMFLRSEMKGDSTENFTEFAFEYLRICKQIFNDKFKEKTKITKISKLIAFTYIWQLLLKLESVSQFFLEAAILQAITIYKSSIEEESTVVCASMGLNLLANVINPKIFIKKYLDGIIPTLAASVCLYPNKKKELGPLLGDALEFLNKADLTPELLQSLQYLNMGELINDAKITKAKIIRDRLYKTSESTINSFHYLLDFLPSSSTYTQFLILSYFSEIIGCDQRNNGHLIELREIIRRENEIQSKLCSTMLRVNKSYTLKTIDVRVAKLCANCIQLLGPSTVSQSLRIHEEKAWISSIHLQEFSNNAEKMGSELLTVLQNLAYKTTDYFLNYLISIWQLKFLLYVDSNGDIIKEIPEELNDIFYFSKTGNSPSINTKFHQLNDKPNKTQITIKDLNYKTLRNLRHFCLCLIGTISNQKMKSVFESIESTIRADTNILTDLVALLIYLSLFFAKTHEQGIEIVKVIAKYFCEVLEGNVAVHKYTIFGCIEYLRKLKAIKIAKMKADCKMMGFDCNETNLLSQQGSYPEDSQSFERMIKNNEEICQLAETIRLIIALIEGIPRKTLIYGAKSIRAYKICLFYFEEECRERAKNIPHASSYMFTVLEREDLELLVEIYRNVNKEDIKSEYLQNIIKSSSAQVIESRKKSIYFADEACIINLWKRCMWDRLIKEYESIDLESKARLCGDEIDFSFSENISLAFIAKIFVEISLLLQCKTSAKFKAQYESLEKLINFFQIQIMIDLCGPSGTSTYFHSFYLYLLFDIKVFISTIKELLKDSGNSQNKEELDNQIEILGDPSNEEKINWLFSFFNDREERLLGKDVDQLKLLYFTHRGLFHLINKQLHFAYYTEQLAVLIAKHREDFFDSIMLLKDCEDSKEYLVDYELQYAKTLSFLASDYQAWVYLTKQADTIKRKVERKTKSFIKTSMILEKTSLYLLKLQEKYNPTLKQEITESYKELIRLPKGNTWEKAFVRFAMYFEKINAAPCDILLLYLSSLENGHKYIWQSLPKALNIWFNFDQKAEPKIGDINLQVNKSLQNMALFKIATAVPLLISRFSHPSPDVVGIIQNALVRLCVECPLQQIWWILNFYFFNAEKGKVAIVPEESQSKIFTQQQVKKKQEFGKITC